MIRALDLDDSADFERWQAFITARPPGRGAHPTDDARWRRLFRDLYGIQSYSWAALDGDGQTTGVASVYRVRSPFTGHMLVTSPFFGFGGLYADNDSVRDALLDAIRAKGADLGVDYIELRLPRALGPPWTAHTDFLESQLDLAETPDTVWSDQLASNVRQNIRKSRTHGLDVSFSTDPGPAYELLCRTLRAHGTPFHSHRLFTLLGRHFPEETAYCEVRHSEAPAAAGVVMTFGGSVITPYIGSLAAHRHTRANYAQYWAIIERCFTTGARRFELGRSPKGSTHIRFKRKWGARDVEVVYNVLVLDERRGYRNVTGLSPVFLAASETWKRLPLPLTRRLGPLFARYVP